MRAGDGVTFRVFAGTHIAALHDRSIDRFEVRKHWKSLPGRSSDGRARVRSVIATSVILIVMLLQYT
jgi:hypothetical protein